MRDWRDIVRVARHHLVEADLATTDRVGLAASVRQTAPLLDGAGFESALDLLGAQVHGLGPLEPLLGDPTVTEVMVNGGGQVWVERSGSLVPVGSRLAESDVLQLIERVVAPLGRHVDRLNPIVDGRLTDGSRVHAVIRPLAVDGPCLTIRRFATKQIPLERMCSEPVADLLRDAIRSHLNVLVSGGSSAGKTTLLNALAAEIPDSERVITVEDAAELRLPGSHVVRLESRPANAEGVGEVRVRDLVRSALRMRPDRIIVGEIRGGEAVDMLQAMNTGHDGSLSTCHANSPEDALRRVETLALMGELDLPLLAIREQIASAVDLVVQMVRRSDGRRQIVRVGEVEPRPGPDGANRVRTLSDGESVHSSWNRTRRRFRTDGSAA